MAVAVHQEVVPADVRLRPSLLLNRALPITAGAVAVVGVTVFAGLRYGLLMLIGLGFGIVLEGLRFGFAGPWRLMLRSRDPRGLLAQLLAIGLTAVVAIPLIAAHAGELTGAVAPIGLAMVGGAFVFGCAMQVVLGCGSGTLVNAGSGNAVGLVALPFFVVGSFLGTLHLDAWTALGTLPLPPLSALVGPWPAVLLTVSALAAVAAVAVALAPRGNVLPSARLLLAATLLAGLAIANLVVAGQPWGVVYGLGLWGAKAAGALGFDPTAYAFWQAPGNEARLGASLLTDITSLTNLGMILGAVIAARWSGVTAPQVGPLPMRAWVAVVLSGLALGYASRLAFGCNVGAFFSGIASGSLHGWVWFAASLLGSWAGLRLRPALGLESRQLAR